MPSAASAEGSSNSSVSTSSGDFWNFKPDVFTISMNCSTSKSSKSMSPDLSYFARLCSSDKTEKASATFWNFSLASTSSKFLSG